MAERDDFRTIFEIRQVNNAPLRANIARKDPDIPGLVSCSMPFTLENGMSYVALGCFGGVWIVDPEQPDFLRRVLDLKGVTWIAVLETYSLVLILAEKVLYCCTLEALDPHNNLERVPHKLTPAVVDFFRLGVWDGHLTVVYKKKSMTDSVFRMLEPLYGRPPPAATEPLVVDFGPDRVYWFQLLKEFYVPTNCTDVVFLKPTVAVLHPNGVEIVDLQTLATATMPFTEALTGQNKSLAKRCTSSKPLGLFRLVDGTFLICYDKFGLFVDRDGCPVPKSDGPPTIDWHGTVYAVVPAAPYVVLFKKRSIEVRHATSGRLEQVMFGNDVRCTWRGPSLLQEDFDSDSTLIGDMQSRLHVLMNAPHGLGPEEVSQQLYDFLPAVSAPSPPPSGQNANVG